MVSYPNRKQVEAALDNVEFLVVQELFLTETAAKAHVVLPACSFAEKDGTYTSAGGAVQRLNRAIKPLGLARSDFDIFNALLGMVGNMAAYAGAAGVFFAEIAANVPRHRPYLTGLGDAGAIRPVSGTSKFLAASGPAPSVETGKMALVTGSALNHNGTLSLYGEGPMYVCPEGYVELSREDAAALKIVAGDSVKVTSATGAITLNAKVGRSRVPKGVVFASIILLPSP